ncbi:MAG: hypothetical protein A2W22_04495 [Candidatus Levybacteria bacterium RBG_16_35_11]|nr:MAG: hypothetical protein A2W22_04495 [Candidatus Levybacteria bacterium RBG_16_35_11]
MERKRPGQEQYVQTRCEKLLNLGSAIIEELNIDTLFFLEKSEVEIARYALSQTFIEILPESTQRKLFKRRSISSPFSPSKEEFHEINKIADNQLYQRLQELLEEAEDSQRAKLIVSAMEDLSPKLKIDAKPKGIGRFKIDQRAVGNWAWEWKNQFDLLDDKREERLIVDLISNFPNHFSLIVERTCDPDCELNKRALVVLTREGLRWVKWSKPGPFEERLEPIRPEKRPHYLFKAEKVIEAAKR